MIHAYIANASLCNIPFLFMCFLCHPYIFTIFVENFYFSLVFIYLLQHDTSSGVPFYCINLIELVKCLLSSESIANKLNHYSEVTDKIRYDIHMLHACI